MVDLTELDGVADGRAENLQEAGYESVEDLVDADPEAIADEVNYLPKDTALDLVVQSQNLVEEQKVEVEESEPQSVTAEVEEAVAESDSEDDGGEEVEEALEELPDEEEFEEEFEDDESDTIEFSITFEGALEYDTFFDAVMGQRLQMLQSNRDGVEAFDHALDQMRASQGVGATVELSMEPQELNDLHNCVRQTMIAYKGDNLIAEMEALQSVLNDINDVRDEHLF